MGIKDLWALQTGALLSQLGMILVPPTALENLYQGKALTGEEAQLFDMHPLLASDLLKHIPRLEEVCRIVAYQEKRFNGGGPPLESQGGEDIPMGARIIKVALDYDLATSRKLPQDVALAQMTKNRDWYDPQVFKALEKLLARGQEALPREVGLRDLTESMIMAEEVHTLDGVLIVPKGFRVTRLLVRLLDNFQEKIGLRLPLKVWDAPEGES
jgi:HD-GYP domain-containing protein (c-di-GMP phosphodiesterase class II)